jgi:predicted HAD superfamily hydrolase
MDGIYSSADARCGKYERKLFEMFLCENKLKADAVLHVGDNEHSDYISAMQTGIISIKIPKITSRLFRDSSYNLHTLHNMRMAHDAGCNFFGSLVSYLAYQREFRVEISSAQRFGINYAVPLLYLFCGWLTKQANKDGVKTLYLMARDGYAISDVLKKIAPNFDFKILNISRRAILFPAATKNKIIWDRFFVSASEKPIINILSDLRLEALSQILDLLPKKGNEKFSEISASKQLEFLGKSYQLALPQMRQEHVDYKKYAKDIGLLSSDVAVVDVGWALSSHEALELVLGHKIHGYYVGKLNNAYSHENIKSFLFESLEMESTQWSHIFSRGVELLELPFIASEDQIVRIVGDEFERRQGFLMDEVRSMVSNEIRNEVIKFIDFISDLHFSEIRDDDAKKYLMEIFSALVINPVPNEYFNLGALPHDRYVAGSGVETISTHWRLPQGTVSVSTHRFLRTIVTTVIRNIRNYGLRVTMKKIYRKMVD